jgi:hypothetical protein
MAVITTRDMEPFNNADIIKNSDFKELAKISRELKLKREETGFSAVQMQNFAIHQHTCSERTRLAILDYYNKKLKVKIFSDKVFK